MRHVKHLLRSPRDAERGWRADIRKLRLECALAVEDLNPLVPFVGHVDVALRINRHAVQDIELARAVATRAPVLNPFSVAIVFRDSGIAVQKFLLDLVGIREQRPCHFNLVPRVRLEL